MNRDVDVTGPVIGGMKTKVFAWCVLAALAGTPLLAQKQMDRLQNSATVLKEVLGMPDSIPKELLDRAECVIVIPSVKKFAVGVGGSYGRGVMGCRGGQTFDGPWGSPAMVILEGGSIGLQLGGQATDYVLLVMNDRGADSILSSKVKLGGDASAAAGPKGRTAGASTDVAMRAEILTYSRARGLFAGVSLEGSTLRQDSDGDEVVYGKKVAARDIVRGGVVAVPAGAQPLVDLLNQHSPQNLSNRPQ
ncbi:MAG: lipid-binding SYLF domain-containing protein [Vicinamibacterales bacterium]